MWNYLANDGQHPMETKIQQNFVWKTKYTFKKLLKKKTSLQQLEVISVEKLFQRDTCLACLSMGLHQWNSVASCPEGLEPSSMSSILKIWML